MWLVKHETLCKSEIENCMLNNGGKNNKRNSKNTRTLTFLYTNYHIAERLTWFKARKQLNQKKQGNQPK